MSNDSHIQTKFLHSSPTWRTLSAWGIVLGCFGVSKMFESYLMQFSLDTTLVVV